VRRGGAAGQHRMIDMLFLRPRDAKEDGIHLQVRKTRNSTGRKQIFTWLDKYGNRPVVQCPGRTVLGAIAAYDSTRQCDRALHQGPSPCPILLRLWARPISASGRLASVFQTVKCSCRASSKIPRDARERTPMLSRRHPRAACVEV